MLFVTILVKYLSGSTWIFIKLGHPLQGIRIPLPNAWKSIQQNYPWADPGFAHLRLKH